MAFADETVGAVEVDASQFEPGLDLIDRRSRAVQLLHDLRSFDHKQHIACCDAISDVDAALVDHAARA